jgi:uncharacterized lipoprotein YajG
MKKLLIFSVLAPLFLASCGKSEEVKTVVNSSVAEKQIVVKGSTVESNTRKIEETSAGMISAS